VNRGDWSRYVVVQSFNHVSFVWRERGISPCLLNAQRYSLEQVTDAKLIQQQLVRDRYLKGFHPDAHAAIAPPLRQILKGPGLWGEAMKEELASFRENGYFLSADPLLSPEMLARVDTAQKRIEPTWLSEALPEGMNALAVQFLMVVKEVGDDLMALIEAPATLALAAELLDMEERGVGGGPNGAGGYIVVEACGCGQPREWIESPVGQQVGWHSDSGSKLAFRTALDPQGASGGNAALRVLPGSATRLREGKYTSNLAWWRSEAESLSQLWLTGLF